MNSKYAKQVRRTVRRAANTPAVAILRHHHEILHRSFLGRLKWLLFGK